MTSNEKITEFLYRFSKPDILFSVSKYDSKDFVEAFNLVKDAGLFEPAGNSFRWNKTALDIIAKGWTYDKYLKKTDDTKPWYKVTKLLQRLRHNSQ
jgi:hypothetical protein